MVECTGLENRRTERYRGFESLTEKNKFAKAHDFVFARSSGLDGFEEVLQQLQSATAIVAVSDISQGYIVWIK